MDICICMAESLPCSPETITILFTGYIPIQNEKFKKIFKIKSTVSCIMSRINVSVVMKTFVLRLVQSFPIS